MKRPILFAVAILAIVVGFLLVSTASAGGVYPEGIEVFTVEGQYFILAPNGSVIQVCPCYSPCNETPPSRGIIITQTVTHEPHDPTVVPTDSPTEQPTQVPTVEPTDVPTEEPTIEPTEEPTKEDKPKCNKGGGNRSEGCDPGNHPERGHDDE